MPRRERATRPALPPERAHRRRIRLARFRTREDDRNRRVGRARKKAASRVRGAPARLQACSWHTWPKFDNHESWSCRASPCRPEPVPGHDPEFPCFSTLTRWMRTKTPFLPQSASHVNHAGFMICNPVKSVHSTRRIGKVTLILAKL